MPLTVLYIDDEPDMGQMFEDNFAGDGVDVFHFADYEKGLAAIADLRPDVILLDYRLPGTTGIELVERIDPAIPVALISGDLSVAVHSRFIRTFVKPIAMADMKTFLAGFARP